MKVCSECGKEKPDDKKHFHMIGSWTYRMCRECMNAKNRNERNGLGPLSRAEKELSDLCSSRYVQALEAGMGMYQRRVES